MSEKPIILNEYFTGEILHGSKKNDTLIVAGGYHNMLRGHEGEDTLKVVASGRSHTLDGGEGNDILYSNCGNNFDNVLYGSVGNDILVSLSTDTLEGGAGNDFIWIHYNLAGKPLALGGDGNDIIIHSLFWQQEHALTGLFGWALEVSLYSDRGDDIIIPFIPLNKLNLLTELENDIPSKYKLKPTEKKPLFDEMDMECHISTGLGQDIIALSSALAKNTFTYINDFNFNEDKLAFDSQEMAEIFLSELGKAKLFSFSELNLAYKGHNYNIDFPFRQPVVLKTTDIDGIEIQYPDLSQEISISCDYALYNPITLADKLSGVTDPTRLNQSLLDFTQKTLSKTYTIHLNKDIFVTTKQTLDLMPNKFQTKDLFSHDKEPESSYLTSLYTYISTGKTEHFLTENIEAVVAVVVVQENINGIFFTTKPRDALIPIPLAERYIQTFEALDFFNKGRFTKIRKGNDQQNPSVSIRLSLILEKKNNHFTTTPLSDPIHVKVSR